MIERNFTVFYSGRELIDREDLSTDNGAALIDLERHKSD